MPNKYRRALDRWVFCDCKKSNRKKSKAASAFNPDELAKLFSGVDYRDLEREWLLRHVACMHYAVSPKRFQWILKMAKYCLAAEDEIIDEEIEDGFFSDEGKEEVENSRGLDDDMDGETLAELIFDDSEEDSIVEEEEEVEDSRGGQWKEEEEVEDGRGGQFEVEEEVDEDFEESAELAIYDATKNLHRIDISKSFSDISVKHKGRDHDRLKEFEAYMNSELSGMKVSVKSLAQLPSITLDAAIHIYPETARQIKQLADEALESFVLKNFESMFSNLSLSTENAVQGEFEIGSFMVLILVLELKPDVLISVWPKIEVNTKSLEQDKILVLAWAISQVYSKDWMVSLFMLVHHLFPLLERESNLDVKSKDVIMDLIESINYWTLLPCKHLGTIKGERVVPPSTLETLARSAFPADSTKRKATKTLRKVYRTLKNVALLASPEEAEQISKQLIHFAVKAAGEGNSYLAKEARNLFICCLTNHPDSSFKQWDNMYLENLDASVFILEKLSVKWLKMLSMNLSVFYPMMMTLKSVALKSEKALASEHDAANRANLKKVQKYTKSILEKAPMYARSILGMGPLDWQNDSVFSGFLSEASSFVFGVAVAGLAFGVAVAIY